jgi:hypothetical protein
MSLYDPETTAWYASNIEPIIGGRCLVHALNQWYMVAIWDTQLRQFIDKDGQPVVAVIEWSYRPNRDEA